MIKCVFFDLDDTLYDYERINKFAINNLLKEVAGRYAISIKEAEIAFNYGRDKTKERMPDCAAQHNRLIYCQKMLEYLGRNPVTDALELYDIYWNTILTHMCLNEGCLEVMEYFKNKAIKIGICTDLTTHIQHRKILKLGLNHYIDYLVTSEEAGYEKPHEEIFKLCLNKAKLLSSEILYIGDNYLKDIIGARNVGIKAILYNPYERGLEDKNCDSIKNFHQILEREF